MYIRLTEANITTINRASETDPDVAEITIQGERAYTPASALSEQQKAESKIVGKLTDIGGQMWVCLSTIDRAAATLCRRITDKAWEAAQ